MSKSHRARRSRVRCHALIVLNLGVLGKIASKTKTSLEYATFVASETALVLNKSLWRACPGHQHLERGLSCQVSQDHPDADVLSSKERGLLSLHSLRDSWSKVIVTLKYTTRIRTRRIAMSKEKPITPSLWLCRQGFVLYWFYCRRMSRRTRRQSWASQRMGGQRCLEAVHEELGRGLIS